MSDMALRIWSDQPPRTSKCTNQSEFICKEAGTHQEAHTMLGGPSAFKALLW